MLLPLDIKFIPEEKSDQDSEEEPELEQCQIERQVSEKTSQPIVSSDMTPLAQSNLEHGQEHSTSNIEHVNLPVDHVDSIDRQLIGTVYHNYHRPALVIIFIFPDLLLKILQTSSGECISYMDLCMPSQA